MLRLEKAIRNGEISIELRQKESFFTTNLRNALLLALAFHLSAILIFHITPFLIVKNTILPPAVVEINFDDPEGATLASLDPEMGPKRHLLAPKMSSPELPRIPKLMMMEQMEYFKETSLMDPLFVAIETQEGEERFFQSSLASMIPPFKAIEIHVTGALAEKMQTPPEIPLTLLDSLIKTSGRVLFAVQVDNRSGQVFWKQKKNGGSGVEHQQLAEKILKELKFELNPDYFVTAGEIEMTFRGDLNR